MKKTIDFIKRNLTIKPQVGLVLGSGLGVLAEEITNPLTIPYEDIPDFPVSTVEGHAGQLVIELAGVPVMTMQGGFIITRVILCKRLPFLLESCRV